MASASRLGIGATLLIIVVLAAAGIVAVHAPSHNSKSLTTYYGPGGPGYLIRHLNFRDKAMFMGPVLGDELSLIHISEPTRPY